MTKQKISELIEALKIEYPNPDCALNYTKDYELLFATRLAAQCTDARVNLITPNLFKKYPTLEDLAKADQRQLEVIIHSSGFYRAKARDIIAASNMLLSEYNGKVPDKMEDLLRLPGVGRKTANLILGDIFKKPGSIVVDTHCIRLTNRIGLVDNEKDPTKIEMKLREKLPPEESNDFCHRLVLHGRAICTARNPKCENCYINHLCKKIL